MVFDRPGDGQATGSTAQQAQPKKLVEWILVSPVKGFEGIRKGVKDLLLFSSTLTC